VDVREEEVDMNLGGEREDSTPITGEIENPTEEIVPVEANETPQIKENHPRSQWHQPRITHTPSAFYTSSKFDTTFSCKFCSSTIS
jgi:hypothetical protein